MATPKALNKTASKIFLQLTDNLTKENNHRRIGGEIGASAIMPACIERLYSAGKWGTVYSIAHYYKQNGDLMRDPDIEFLQTKGGKIFPMSFRQDGGIPIDDIAIEIVGGKMTFSPRKQASITSFANQWMKNIKEQQPEYFAHKDDTLNKSTLKKEKETLLKRLAEIDTLLNSIEEVNP